jgi:hypothetical protein
MSSTELPPPDDRVSASYRYLRLGIVVMVAMLGVSLVIEIIGSRCRLGSISSYYYTPVHSVFVGALLAIGMCLVAVKGHNPVEDMFLDIAGVLAAVVALVPTDRPGNTCTSADVTVSQTALVRNNIPSLLIALGASLGIAYVFARRQGMIGSLRQQMDRPMVVGLTIEAVLLIAGVIWYNWFNDSFRRKAHGSAAVAMFVAAWCAILVNAGWPKRALTTAYQWLGLSTPEAHAAMPPSRCRTAYRYLSVLMPVGALVMAPSWFEWRQRILVLEAYQIGLFGAFWAIQTFDRPPRLATLS